ncbi:MAG TPA: hypothetical protein VEB21_05215, partial [Terriglobales bacterium]|nr:hypothetical protein [Terriglobales bacterium]
MDVLSGTKQIAARGHSHAPDEAGDRRPLWWYARLVRNLCPGGGRLFHWGCGDGELLKQVSGHFEAYGYDDAALTRHRCRTNVTDAVVLEDPTEIPDESIDVVLWLGAI